MGASELLLFFLVALLVFGAKRLPEIARGLGQGLREFRSATHEITREIQRTDPPSAGGYADGTSSRGRSSRRMSPSSVIDFSRPSPRNITAMRR